MSAKTESGPLSRLQAVARELEAIKADALNRQQGGLAGNVDMALSYVNAMIAVTATLSEEYRPAWEIEPGWEIRTEDQRWLRVVGWLEWTSSIHDTVIELALIDGSVTLAWVDDLIMTRRSP